MKAKNVKLVAEHFKHHMVMLSGGGEMLSGYRLALRDTAENLATVLKLDNPKFDRDKFLKGSGF